jgi:hypothetical protein
MGNITDAVIEPLPAVYRNSELVYLNVHGKAVITHMVAWGVLRLQRGSDGRVYYPTVG